MDTGGTDHRRKDAYLNILYVAKHESGGSDDEGAITHALRELGHRVRCIEESQYAPREMTYDLFLFHKFYDSDAIRRTKARVKAFWHFDLVRSDQWDRVDWERERVGWMDNTGPVVDYGFCTDGDWVADAGLTTTYGKNLRWLTQGADGRVVGFGKPVARDIDVLFVGSVSHGGKRASHVERLRAKYGDRLKVVGETRRNSVYGRPLADLVAQSKVVVCPDAPVTDRYWSNRVYNMLGFGAFVIHPYSRGLAEQFDDGRHLAFYGDRDYCEELIDAALKDDSATIRARWKACMAGHGRVYSDHLYRHRCEELIRVVTGGKS